MEWRHKDLISLEGWTREELHFFLEQADYMEELMNRPIKKVPALRGKMVVNCFFENSTRTRVSFELAEKMLSADVVNWSASGSSTSKGETLRDTVWTLEAMGADAVVVRHGAVGVPDYLSKKLHRASVFNAGDGTNGHPTQALLDLHSARKKLGDLDGAKMAMIGDVLHSRVARSDIQAFRKMGVTVTLSGPATLIAGGYRFARRRVRCRTLAKRPGAPTSSTSFGFSASGRRTGSFPPSTSTTGDGARRSRLSPSLLRTPR